MNDLGLSKSAFEWWYVLTRCGNWSVCIFILSNRSLKKNCGTLVLGRTHGNGFVFALVSGVAPSTRIHNKVAKFLWGWWTPNSPHTKHAKTFELVYWKKIEKVRFLQIISKLRVIIDEDLKMIKWRFLYGRICSSWEQRKKKTSSRQFVVRGYKLIVSMKVTVEEEIRNFPTGDTGGGGGVWPTCPHLVPPLTGIHLL